MPATTERTLEALWRIESPRLVAGLTRIVRDVGVAEELAQDAVVAAMETWPRTGVPDAPGAWLMTTAKRRALDLLRRRAVAGRAQDVLESEHGRTPVAPDVADEAVARAEDVGDDLLRLMS